MLAKWLGVVGFTRHGWLVT